MTKQQPWWIKERYNPQLGTYFVLCGRMPTKEARAAERGSLYGTNTMLRFDTEGEYQDKARELREAGERVQ